MANLTAFEVEVEIKQGNPFYWYYAVRRGTDAYKGTFTRNKITKTLHILATKPQHAREKAEKYGRVRSCQKVDEFAALRGIENLELNQKPLQYGLNSPYTTAIHMDEMIWQKQNKKRANLYKDKEAID